MSVQIKICGIRRPQDVDYINEYLPDYAGFIFWGKSFRYVTLQEACALRRRMDPRIPTVGVFVNEAPAKIAEYVHSGAIRIVQLHGQETEEDVAELRTLLPSVPLWKAFKVRSLDDLQKAQPSTADQILLDNGYGTGQCFDHSLLTQSARERVPKQSGRQPDTGSDQSAAAAESPDPTPDPGDYRSFHRPYILAGGLTPENIPEVIRKYHPSMVDISSGVETDKYKDPDKIRKAIQAAHGA
ncbi:MAG: phosphoribosylanthranilate isomerase [Lachnospiraceae bacterium]|nr:phosphoribosylanthranilate isomerase [Lachnospiraceae bacterium]